MRIGLLHVVHIVHTLHSNYTFMFVVSTVFCLFNDPVIFLHYSLLRELHTFETYDIVAKGSILAKEIEYLCYVAMTIKASL